MPFEHFAIALKTGRKREIPVRNSINRWWSIRWRQEVIAQQATNISTSPKILHLLLLGSTRAHSPVDEPDGALLTRHIWLKIDGFWLVQIPSSAISQALGPNGRVGRGRSDLRQWIKQVWTFETPVLWSTPAWLCLYAMSLRVDRKASGYLASLPVHWNRLMAQQHHLYRNLYNLMLQP